jgi:hypothetical protein
MGAGRHSPAGGPLDFTRLLHLGAGFSRRRLVAIAVLHSRGRGFGRIGCCLWSRLVGGLGLGGVFGRGLGLGLGCVGLD